MHLMLPMCSEVSFNVFCSHTALRHVPFTGQRPLQLATLSDQVPILECGGFDTYLQAVGWKLGWILLHDRHGALEKEVCVCVSVCAPHTLSHFVCCIRQVCASDVLLTTVHLCDEWVVWLVGVGEHACDELRPLWHIMWLGV